MLLMHNHQFGATSMCWTIPEAPFEWYFIGLDSHRSSELWIAWSSLSPSLWVISIPHTFLESFPVFTWNTDLYYLAFPKDRMFLKCIVYGIYFLELVQSALIIKTGFRIFVTMFGDVEVLDQIEMAWLSVPILTSIGEVFYVHELLKI